MIKRVKQIIVRLNLSEHQHLKIQVKKSGLSQEAYIRSLINGYIPRELPPLDYHSMIRELHAIGNNLNQIAAKVNTTGHIDTPEFKREAAHLNNILLMIRKAVTQPERINDG